MNNNDIVKELQRRGYEAELHRRTFKLLQYIFPND